MSSLVTSLSLRDFFISTLTANPLIGHRYKFISCIGYDPANPAKKKGCFSLVLKCQDTIEDNVVILKFFDPNLFGTPQMMYRYPSFEREPKVLETLRGKKRCLQLVEGIKEHVIEVSAGFNVTLTYFVMKFYAEEIEPFFLLSDKQVTAEAKLVVFNELVLAVKAIHKEDIFHRDLKADNFRRHGKEKKISLAIDFGTAAKMESIPIGTAYDQSPARNAVGAISHSSPEALCGLPHVRKIAKYSDCYALGCLLFELFNSELYGIAIRKTSKNYDLVLAAISSKLKGAKDEKQLIDEYRQQLDTLKTAIDIPNIDTTGHDIPEAIIDNLNIVFRSLVAFDYAERMGLDIVLAEIQKCLKIVRSRALEKRKIEYRRQARAKKKAALEKREAKLKIFLSAGRSSNVK